MMPLDGTRLRQAQTIFDAVIGLPLDQQRHALSERCGSDAELREVIERLIEGDRRAETSMAEPIAFRPAAETRHPSQIGPYRILRLLGEGGMGVVYEAEREHPRRTVALKVLRSGILSPRVAQRFEHESELLAQLQHPGIASVFDAGTAEFDGPVESRLCLPWFAMELIHGRPLTDYAAERGLSTRERLALFADVCDAVHHAHRRGVIHRDLKPSNILVNEEGRPKILDFGVARAVQPGGDPATLQTADGQLIGTLPYMSPEQVAGEPGAVDTRSDVYSLGVVGFELLTGRMPIDISQQSLPAAMRMLAEHASARAGAMRRELRGDVEAILGKALEKDPDRRYASAAEFAEDIRRFLRSEPIAARRPTAWYTLRMAMARHRAVTALLGLVVVLACGSAIGLALLNWRAVRGWQEAKREGRAAATARSAEHDARVAAESVSRFLHEMLAAASPAEKGRDVSVVSLLKAATQRLDAGELHDQPVAAAAVFETIGTTWQGLGDYAEAEAHFSRSLALRRELYGDVHADVATSLNHVGEARFLRTDYAGAEQCFAEALEVRRRLFGELNPDVAECYNNLAFIDQARGRLGAAQQRLQEALRIWRATLGEDNANVELCLNNLACLMVDQGDHRSAEPLLREVYALRVARFGRKDHPFVCATRNNLALCLSEAGMYAEAEQLHRENLEIYRRTLPANHTDRLTTIVNLTVVLREEQRFEEAERLLREAIAATTLDELDATPSTANLYAHLGLALTDQHKYDEAEPILRRVLEHYVRRHGEAHDTVSAALNNLAEVLASKGDFDAAVSCMQRVMTIDERLYGARPHSRHAGHLHHFGHICLRRGEYDRAEALLGEALDIKRATQGADHPDVALSLFWLGQTHVRRGHDASAGPLFDEALGICSRRLSPKHRLLLEVRHASAQHLTRRGSFAEAETMLHDLHAELETLPFALLRTEVLRSCVALYENWNLAEPSSERGEQAAHWRSLLVGSGGEPPGP